MATTPATIHVFDVIYRAYNPNSPTQFLGPGNIRLFNFYNSKYSPSMLPTASVPAISSRETASALISGYRAIPAHSLACDFMWNVLVPSWSYSTSTKGGTTTWLFTPTYTSESFLYRYNPVNSATDYRGVSSQAVTSSWIIMDPKFISWAYTASTPPTLPSATPFTYELNYPTGSLGYDGRYFDVVGGAAISRTDVSASMAGFAIKAGVNNITATEFLKRRRLFFPTPGAPAAHPTGSNDYWLEQLTGYRSSSWFDQNGGIYNVKFTLKRSGSYSPDPGSFMSIFIHNVIPQYYTSSIGADGYYPPDANIIKVGHGYSTAPIMSFYDSSTGYLIEQFDITLIQYGFPAQLVFEPSGSADSNSYFGIVVDDVQICKIGVSTDPRFIKPDKVSSVIATTRGLIIGGGSTGSTSAPPPAPVD